VISVATACRLSRSDAERQTGRPPASADPANEADMHDHMGRA
jgi:hypothetical protein